MLCQPWVMCFRSEDCCGEANTKKAFVPGRPVVQPLSTKMPSSDAVLLRGDFSFADLRQGAEGFDTEDDNDAEFFLKEECLALAEELRIRAAEKLEAALGPLREEFEAQKMVWESAGSSWGEDVAQLVSTVQSEVELALEECQGEHGGKAAPHKVELSGIAERLQAATNKAGSLFSIAMSERVEALVRVLPRAAACCRLAQVLENEGAGIRDDKALVRDCALADNAELHARVQQALYSLPEVESF
mmetsp:Transcript_19368/g.45423  ORF Transcript_19368/g.45423 Transcript_19368/m.45423 type:complete len:245 (-) Transcript_19368:90-824(-)|eukprot:CAMPEP_0171106316 /NCGR_PEP_ID=MMETSP0766_2-20121228/64504_1 /TAXON_ID=439317 /ORGANISM="Gambierdiscus australes, Strain CAWD 149" /LENGTH=244 /DNA_ID=CAMNT_0011567387 /DNA_START=94 /DNA_END=828 /DNA_ORIENTATION=+